MRGRIHIPAWLFLLFAYLVSVVGRCEVTTLRVLVNPESPPFDYLVDDKLVGFGVDVARRLADMSHVTLHEEIVPFARGIAVTREVPNTMTLTIARTPTRESWFHWIGPIAVRETWVYKLKTREDIVVKTVDDAKRYVVTDDEADADYPALLGLGFVKGVNLDPSSSDMISCRKIKAHRIDLLLQATVSLAGFAKACDLRADDFVPLVRFSSAGGYYLAVSGKSDPELLGRLDKAFATLLANGELARMRAVAKLN
ncbi:MAG: transporter substrate-binding domain-containing protein [Burkholderiales bacterium]|nr:transporter substrate-binding domain-containing protein [Burkholderiales bacterium]